MKKLLTILFSLFGLFAAAQVYTPQTAAGYQYKRVMADSTLHIPSFCGVPVLRDVAIKKAAIAADTCNHLLYLYDPNLLTWSVISGGGGGATDTTSLSFRIDQKAEQNALIDSAHNIRADFPAGVAACPECYSSAVAVNDSTLKLYRQNGDSTSILFSLSGSSILSFAKNITNDSTVLLLADGRRFAVLNNSGGGTNKFYDSTSLNYNSTKYIFYNGSTPVDSASITAAANLATTNLIQTGSHRVYNANNGYLGFSNVNNFALTDNLAIAGFSSNVNLTNIFNQNPVGAIQLYSPTIHVPTLPQDNSLTRVLVRDNTGLGQLFWRDVASIVTSETDPLSVHITDSATMLFPYLSKTFAAATYATVANLNLKQNLITLTTTGSSGAATFNQGTGALNIPSYLGGVTSFNTRAGAVVSAAGDYSYAQITRTKQVHNSGATVTVNNATDWLIVKPALASITITLAATPADGQRVDISFKLAVTLVTVSPNTGQAIKDANGVSSVEAGESIAYQYDATDFIWYRL